MKVVFGNYTICEGGDDSPSNLEIDGSSVVEVAELVRAEEVSTFDRQNEQTRITFERNIEEGSYLEAQNRMMIEKAATPRKGDLVLTAEASYQYQVFQIADASMPRIKLRQKGVTVTISYEFVGGTITAI
jgi:hypothetical protein